MTEYQYSYVSGELSECKGIIRDGRVVDSVVETDILHRMMKEVTACNEAKGWHDVNPRFEQFLEFLRANNYYVHDNVILAIRTLFGPRTFGDDIALLHSEVSEMLEAHRDGNMVTSIREDGKPEGMPSEAADVLVRLLDTCDRYGIDLFHEWRLKLDFNWTRPMRHGGKAL